MTEHPLPPQHSQASPSPLLSDIGCKGLLRSPSTEFNSGP